MGALFFSAEGRVGRTAYWFGALVLLAAGLLAGAVPLIGWAVQFVVFYAWVCLISKRLHDVGRSGWLQFIPVTLGWTLMAAGGWLGFSSLKALFAGSLGALLPAALAAGALAVGFVLVGGLVHLLFVVLVGLRPGEPGFNRWGPPPGEPLVRT